MKWNVHDEKEFKYLQYVILAEHLDNVIRETREAVEDDDLTPSMTMSDFALLKAYRKNLDQEF